MKWDEMKNKSQLDARHRQFLSIWAFLVFLVFYGHVQVLCLG